MKPGFHVRWATERKRNKHHFRRLPLFNFLSHARDPPVAAQEKSLHSPLPVSFPPNLLRNHLGLHATILLTLREGGLRDGQNNAYMRGGLAPISN